MEIRDALAGGLRPRAAPAPTHGPNMERVTPQDQPWKGNTYVKRDLFFQTALGRLPDE